MTLDGEIVLIDNDKFEKSFLQEIVKRLEYDVSIIYLRTAMEGYDYLKNTKKEIFLVISEIQFDTMNGLELKRKINNEKTLNGNHPHSFLFPITLQKPLLTKRTN